MMLVRAVAVWLVLLGGIAVADDDEAQHILVTFEDPGMSHSARPGPARPGYSRRSGTYLVSFSVRRAADRVARDFDLQIVDEWPIVPLNVHCLVYAVPDDVALDSLLTDLRQRPEVESAQLLNRFQVQGTPPAGSADPYGKLQHNLETMEVSQAHAWTRGAGSRVTIIDTGIDLQHPELVTQVREHHDFVTGAGRREVADAHGTAIAGIIAAASENGIGMTGIAPETELTVLRACWHDPASAYAVCDSFTLAKALTHALESKTDVINLSLGGPHDALLARLVNLALQRGILVVAAAPRQAGFPTDVPGVIVVGSGPVSDSAETAFRLTAPGDDILVPVPGGGFDYASGTSLSAAQVSGVIALLVAERPGLRRDDVTALLAGSRTAPQAPVNACRALAQLLGRGGCRETATANHYPWRESEGNR